MPHKRLFPLFVLGLTFIGIVFANAAFGWKPKSDHPWPMFHGNYDHSGYVAVKGPRDGKLLWKFKAGSGEKNSAPPNSAAVAADGTIFVGSPEKILALKSNGKLKWSKKYTNVQGPALSADGKMLYFAGENALFALHADNGKKQWQIKMKDKALFGPTIGPDEVIYQGSWDGYLYAVKPNGKLKWKYKTDGALSYPASINKDNVIFFGGGDAHAGPDSNIYALTSKGKLKWKYDTEQTRVGSPAINVDGVLYFPAAPALFAMKASGELKWKMGPDTGGGDDDSDDNGDGTPPGGDDGEDLQRLFASDDVAGIITPAVAADGTIYIGNSDGVISAVNPDTQTVKWTYQTGADPDETDKFGLPSFPVVDKDGVVYMGSLDRYMYAINKKGELVWRYKTGGGISEAAPALGADGTLYFTSDDGYLYAIRDKK